MSRKKETMEKSKGISLTVIRTVGNKKENKKEKINYD